MARIITIGREFGSGGRELGRRLAEALNIEYYDKEILVEIARHTSLAEEYIRNVVDRQPHSLMPITIGRSFAYVENYAFKQAQTVFQAQSEIIRKMAERGVATNVHYKPLPLLTAYKDLGFDIADYPHAYGLYKEEVTLPLYSRLSDEEVQYVISSMQAVVSEVTGR